MQPPKAKPKKAATWAVVLILLIVALLLPVFLRKPAGLGLPLTLRLPPAHLVAGIPVATRFDMPIGSEHGALTYNAQPFGVRDVSHMPHLGDDLNGCFGENTDFGDPVRAVADGLVIFAGTGTPGLGNIIILLHRMPDDGRLVQSFYAHLESVEAIPWTLVARGERIGSIGNADGLYYAHLHIEMRAFANPWIGGGYREDFDLWMNPTETIRRYRGAPDDDLLPAIALTRKARLTN